MSGRMCLLASFFLLASCGGNEGRTEDPLPVRITVLVPETISRTVYAPCRLEAEDEAVISVALPSRVDSVFVEPGDTVSAGQRLMALRTDDMHRAEMAGALATLEAARASREYAEDNLRRSSELLQRGAISLHDHQRTETESAMAEATFTRAAAGHSAAVNSAGRGYVTAPFGGVVGRVMATRGNPAAGPLLSLFSSGSFKAELLVAPRHLPFLRPGLPAVYETDHFPGMVFPGSVTSVAAGADPVSGLVSLTAQFTDTAGLLIPGLSGRVMLALETREGVPVLGEDALTPVGECCWEVAVIRDGRVELTDIESGISSGNRHEITRGLSPGDSVITLGHSLITPGEPFRVVE